MKIKTFIIRVAARDADEALDRVSRGVFMIISEEVKE